MCDSVGVCVFVCVVVALCSSVSLPNGCGGVCVSKREKREETAGREQLCHSRWKQVS